MTPLFALSLAFQAIASSICAANHYASPTADVCFVIAPSATKPGALDAQVLDLAAGEYLETKWLDSTTMLSKIETATTTYCWYDDQTEERFGCEPG